MRVQVHINFGENNTGSTSEGTYPEVVNVSKTEKLFSEPSAGCKGFQLSPDKETKVSTLDGTYGFYPQSGYTGVITRSIANERGTFTPMPVITFTLHGYNFEYLYIVFDQASNEYATTIALFIDSQGYVIDNDSTFMRIDLRKYLPNTTAGIYNVELHVFEWSKPFASAKITYIACAYAETFTGRDIIRAVCSENALNSRTIVQPGIVEQYADISLYDRHQRLHLAAEENKLLTNANIQIVALADDDAQTLLGTFKAHNWDVENDNSIVQLSAADPSVNFDKIRVEDVPVKNRTLHDMLTLLFSYTKGYSWKYDSWYTQNYCETISTPNSWLKADYLSNLFKKVCTMGMLRIYWTNGTFVVMKCW